MLELNLALPYPDYQQFVDASFAHAGGVRRLYRIKLSACGSCRDAFQCSTCCSAWPAAAGCCPSLSCSDDHVTSPWTPLTQLPVCHGVWPSAADADRDGRLSVADFIPLYKSIAAVRRAFRRQDHHSNGQIDRCVYADAWLRCLLAFLMVAAWDVEAPAAYTCHRKHSSAPRSQWLGGMARFYSPDAVYVPRPPLAAEQASCCCVWLALCCCYC
jgi:hypothetical protein